MTVWWPSVAIGAVVGAYWTRVLKMVIKARRRTGRGANFVPREPLGRALRAIWYPVVVLWIVLPFADGFGWGTAPVLRATYRNTTLDWTCAAVAAGALAATWVCWRRMGKSWRMGIDPAEKTSLVVTGPYAYVRHPIYALSSMLMVASAVAVPSVLMIVAAVTHLGFLQWEARREERFLVAIHGPAYGEYQTRVGRFLPRSVRPFIPSGRNGA